MRSRILILLLALMPPVCFATNYSTTFPATENPISESGKWVNGGTAGIDWTNMRTTANTVAYGTDTGADDSLTDSIAILQGIGGWGRNQYASGVVYLNGSPTNADFQEVELFVNETITAHSITGYICDYSLENNGSQYFAISRWDGAIGTYTVLQILTPGSPTVSNGDKLVCTNIGGKISQYDNGVLIQSVTDTTYTGGSPGMGSDLSSGAATNPNFGFSSFYASDYACPSIANYTSPTNPIGSLVTLASMGINNCMYIDAVGSDSNSGADEGHPWAHAPGMASATGVPAAVSFVQGTQLAGDGFIFRGGDTFHFGHNTGDYTGGVWEWNPSSGGPYGTSSHPIYLGVDQTWYSGGSWARPIFTADNSPCGIGTTGTMPDGATCTSGTDSFGQTIYYVSSCVYQVAASGGVSNANDIYDGSNNTYIILDNIEMTGLCQMTSGNQTVSRDTYVLSGNSNNSGVSVTNLNLYIHGASHLQFTDKNGSSNCTLAGHICINVSAFAGGSSNGNIGDSEFFNVVDFSDSDPAGENLDLGGFYNVAYNVFRYWTQLEPNHPGGHVFHDNLLEYVFSNGHSNAWESQEVLTTNAVYNNILRHVFTANTGDVVWWLGPSTGVTDYFFNNITYDVGSSEYFNMGGQGLGPNPGNYTVFNNTFQSAASGGIWGCTNSPGGIFSSINNHFVTDAGSINTCSVGTLTTTTPLLMSNSTATTDGYTSGQTYAYSPTVQASPTVNAGTSVQSSCSALATAALTDPTLSDAATACARDTRYGIVYNAATHTASYPGRSSVARPTSQAPDIGAYEFGTVVIAPATSFFSLEQH